MIFRRRRRDFPQNSLSAVNIIMTNVPADVMRIEQIRDMTLTRTDMEDWSRDRHRPVNLTGMNDSGNSISHRHQVHICGCK